MRVYYLNKEYEPNKHKIVKVWFAGAKPEESPRTTINVPYSVLDIDEDYNPTIHSISTWFRPHVIDDGIIPAKYCINNDGQIVNIETGLVVAINPNPQKAAYKLSQLHGLTQQQLENYIDNNMTNLAQAKEIVKKLAAVVLWLVKQTRLDE